MPGVTVPDSFLSQDAPDLALRVSELGKRYRLYARPSDRLKQMLWRGRRVFGREFWALRDVSFDVRRGEAVGILGRNGSGKSTLLQVVAGILRPTCGQVEVAGRVAALLELGTGFNPELSGRDNTILVGATLGLTRDEVENRFEDIAAFADIGEFIDYPVKLYSTGMFIRLAFAIQTVLRPDIFIIDEALSVGDYPFQRKSVRHLEAYIHAGGTVLITTHDPGLVQRLCTRALVFHDGQLVVDDEPAIAAHQYMSRFSQMPTRVGSATYPQVPVAREHADLSVAAFMQGAIPRPPKSDFLGKDVEMLGVRIENITGSPCLIFRPGDTMVVRTLFCVHAQDREVSNGLLLHTMDGALVWGGGAVNQGSLLKVSAERCYISTVEVTLTLGPGRYTLTAGVGTPNLDNNSRTGEFHDRFVNLADIQVLDFDLDEHQPIPFWGVARLPFRIPPLRELC